MGSVKLVDAGNAVLISNTMDVKLADYISSMDPRAGSGQLIAKGTLGSCKSKKKLYCMIYEEELL
jgi:excinuclease UvrABC ATPase subunit